MSSCLRSHLHQLQAGGANVAVETSRREPSSTELSQRRIRGAQLTFEAS